MRRHCAAATAALILFSIALAAAVIGASTAAPPLTAERIAQLPPDRRAAWKEYLDTSDRQMAAGRAALIPGVPASAR